MLFQRLLNFSIAAPAVGAAPLGNMASMFVELNTGTRQGAVPFPFCVRSVGAGFAPVLCLGPCACVYTQRRTVLSQQRGLG